MSSSLTVTIPYFLVALSLAISYLSRGFYVKQEGVKCQITRTKIHSTHGSVIGGDSLWLEEW